MCQLEPLDPTNSELINRAEDEKFPDKNIGDAENSGSIDIGFFGGQKSITCFPKV